MLASAEVASSSRLQRWLSQWLLTGSRQQASKPGQDSCNRAVHAGVAMAAMLQPQRLELQPRRVCLPPARFAISTGSCRSQLPPRPFQPQLRHPVMLNAEAATAALIL